MPRNTNSFSTLIAWSAALVSALLLSACVDDDLGNIPGVYPEGETTVSLEAAFSPFAASSLESRAIPPGNAMSDISDLVVLAYDKNGNLIRDISPVRIDFTQADVKDEDRTDNDASNGNKAEDVTKCLRKTLTLPYGEYYLIAVANLGEDYTGDPGNMTPGVKDTWYELTNPEGRYYGKYETLSELREMEVEWIPTNYKRNREMLGYFTNNTDRTHPDVPSATKGFQTVKINSQGISLRAWLRRCASKVTIDFDGSGLRENVHVYIKDARIYDIPKYCTLGFGRDGDTDYNNHPGKGDELLASVHSIDYGTGSDFHAWPEITKGRPYIYQSYDKESPLYNVRKEFHGAANDALYFYENMQGDAPKGKLPVADLVNGGVENADLVKDGVPYGTYIEVTAHYYSMSDGNIAEGDIKYRFMLGKDVEKSCDAERNFHYKLTLKLRGNANDYDWHIDFKDDGFIIPNPWYVSYLYNHNATMPFKYTPPAGYKVVRLKAEITENPWYPAYGQIPDGEDKHPAAYKNPLNKGDGNGFLSLHWTHKSVVTLDDAGYPELLDKGTFLYGNTDKAPKLNDAYYYGKAPSNSTINRSERTYYFDGTADDTNSGKDAYSYTKDGDKYTFYIPLFTRAKVLVKQTGYSGNNPFVGYERHAKVRITATIENIATGTRTTEWDTTTVRQVRRVVNPKGVYRKPGNNEDFDVTLMRLHGDNEEEFNEFESDGPWMAEIIGDKNFITLDGRQFVTGSTKTPIKFKIKFNKLNSNPNDQTVRNAVVRVKYHNYTCTHLIFVRQGYAPQAISKTGVNMNGSGQKATVWNTFNSIVYNVKAEDPRDEGSLFKFNQIGRAIDAYSNVYRKADGTVDYNFPTEDAFKTPPAIYLAENEKGDRTYLPDPVSWSSITAGGNGWSDRNIATARDFEQLYLTPNIQFGYGVLYADGATTTQKKVADAYGWYRFDLGDKPDNKKGMRGMFAYYWDENDPGNEFTAKNIFFPIGRSGYGHRKNAGGETPGTLRYSCNRNGYASVFENVAPLFCHLYRRPGAIYYARVPSEKYLGWDGKESSDWFYALDINYFTFDVNAITSGNVNNGQDACFLRFVE